MSANTFPHAVEVATIAELTSVHVAELQLGASAYVDANSEIYYLVENAALVVDGVTVIQPVTQARVGKPNALWATAAASGGSITPPSPAAVLQADWYIDPINGSDTNDGKTPATALATLTEWTYRIGLQTIEIPLMTVHVLNDLLSGDTPMGPINLIGGAGLTIEGIASPVVSGVFSAVTAANPATNTPWSATAAPIVWGPHIAAGRRIKMIAGASVNAVAWPVLDLGGNAARFSWPADADPAAGPFGQSQRTLTTDAFDVEDMTSLGDFALRVNSQPTSVYTIVDCKMTGGTFDADNGGGQSSLYGCQMGGSTSLKGANYVNCGSTSSYVHAYGAAVSMLAGSVNGDLVFSGGPFSIVDQDFLVQSGNVQVFGPGELIFAAMAVFDWALGSGGSGGIQLWQGVQAQSFDFLVGVKRIWGTTANVGTSGFRIESGSYFEYNTNTTGLTITGVAGDVVIGSGGPVKAYAALPYVQGGFKATTVNTVAVPALANAAFNVQTGAAAGVTQVGTQPLISPQTDPGANVGWVARVSAPDQIEIKMFTTLTAGTVAVPGVTWNVAYVLEPGPFAAGMILL